MKKMKKNKKIYKQIKKTKKTKNVKTIIKSKVKYELKENSYNLSKVSEQEIKNIEGEIKYIDKGNG